MARGRPMNEGSDNDKIAKFNARKAKVYKGSCGCKLETRVTLLDDPYCGKHNCVLTLQK